MIQFVALRSWPLTRPGREALTDGSWVSVHCRGLWRCVKDVVAEPGVPRVEVPRVGER